MNDDLAKPPRPAAVFLAALLGGCAVGPNFHPPQPAVPAAWAGVAAGRENAASVATEQTAQLVRWWENFHDPKLTSLIEQALHANLNLQIAGARLREARASRAIAAGVLWPSLAASGSYQREGGNGTISPNQFQAGLDALWEIDIFGGTRRSVEAAGAAVQAARENLHDVQVTLAAEVALDYIQLRASQEQIAIAGENLKAEQHTAELTRKKLAAGFASALDAANANAQAATTAAAIPPLETAVRQSIYSLSVLLARPPADLLDDLSGPGPLPLTPPEIPVGLPSDLVRRRPDIREAEAQLHAATANIGVAVSDFFPSFSLTGSVGWQNDRLRPLFDSANRQWSFGPQIKWPLLQGGSTVANLRLQQALRDESYLAYRQTVLSALLEVENNLIAFAKEWERRKALEDAVVFNRRALELSQELYARGEVDFVNVLDAERSLYSSQTSLSQSRQSISTDLVALYKALGGGWTDAPPSPAAGAATPAPPPVKPPVTTERHSLQSGAMTVFSRETAFQLTI